MQKRYGRKYFGRGKPGTILLVALVSLVLVLGGCGRRPEGGENVQVQTDRSQDTVRVTLYFADDQAQFLTAEEREVIVNGKSLPEVVVEELIKGSQTGLGQTIPLGTRLLSLEVDNGVAMVNFSREFKENHWGGSAAETMTVYSIVNSLARLDGIERVQFLLEGEIQEELLGHMYYGEPIEPDWKLVAEG